MKSWLVMLESRCERDEASGGVVFSLTTSFSLWKGD